MVVLILYQYDIKYVTKCNTKFKKCRKYGTLRVDLTGVEPVSEKKSVRVSPGAVCLLNFPWCGRAHTHYTLVAS